MSEHVSSSVVYETIQDGNGTLVTQTIQHEYLSPSDQALIGQQHENLQGLDNPQAAQTIRDGRHDLAETFASYVNLRLHAPVIKDAKQPA